MANMINNIGMSDLFEEKDLINGTINFIVQTGKPFGGYSNSLYFYKDMGSSELWATTLLDNETKSINVVDFHTHAGNMCNWEMIHTGLDLSSEDMSVTEHIGLLTKADGESGMIPIDIFNADVLPSYMNGDRIKVQVAGFPVEISYYDTEEDYLEKASIGNDDEKWSFSVGSLLPINFLINHGVENYDKTEDFSSDVLVNFTAKVTNLYLGTLELDDNEETTHICCVIDTDFGQLELHHTLEQIPQDNMNIDNIRVGAIVSGVCIISGDVALDEYGNGAVKDFEHDLTALRYIITDAKYDKLKGITDDKTVYRYEASESDIVGTDEIIKKFQFINKDRENGKKYSALFATITSVDNEALKYTEGTRCLVIQAGEPNINNNYEAIMFIDVDDEGIITEINVSTDSGYYFDAELPADNSCDSEDN